MNFATQKASLLRWLLAFSLLLIGGFAHAEGGCPPGMIPEGGQGVSSCRPIPGYSQPQGHWVSQWGAIATDVSYAGASYNQLSEEDARQAAIASCVSNGGSHCKVEITYRNQCVAMVEGNTGHNEASADTIDHALQITMKTCADAGDTNCHRYYTSCSLPKIVQ